MIITAAKLIEELQRLPPEAMIRSVVLGRDGGLIEYGDHFRSLGAISLDPSKVAFAPLAGEAIPTDQP